MNFDAFTGGVEPGGLRTKNEVRILICYLLAGIEASISKSDLISVAVDNGLANYFEVAGAIAEMTKSGIIVAAGEKGELCAPTETARMISKQLDRELPPTVRRKALTAALDLLAKEKRERENRVEISREGTCCRITCHISGGETDLMSLSLRVPDLAQANVVKENFQRSPETVYRMMLALVTGESDLAADLLKSSGSRPEN